MRSTAAHPATESRGHSLSGLRIFRSGGSAHLTGTGVLFLVAVWLCRAILFAPGLPAGTDMLGFVARAQESSTGLRALSLWNSAALGSRRSFTLESLLGLITKLTTSPIVTVKLVAFLTVLGAGMCAYLLCWRWSGSRLAATIAGLLYMTSQLEIGQFASGHLNVLVAVAAAPALVLVWAGCVDDFRITRALAFSLIASLIVLARLDMLVYLAPFLLMYPVIRVAVHGGARGTARNAVLTLAAGLMSGLLLNAYLLVPIMGGVRAGWLSAGGHFTQEDFLARSIAGYPTLLGMAREIGYLAFTKQQTWYSHPFLPGAMYWLVVSFVVILAYSAVWLSRNVRTLFLVACAIVAALLGKGFRQPLGAPYQWLIEHIPFFENLRDPNRWLIVETLAYAVLAGITLSYVVRRCAAWAGRRISQPPRRLAPIAGLALLTPIMAPTAPTFIRGFMTERPTKGQIALLQAVHDDPGDFVVATIPYNQPRRYMAQGGYQGWEHDLGTESSAFTGHPTLGDGGWHRPTASFVAYTSQLLARGDPAFQKLLGTVGVRYLLKFNYPATDRDLLRVGGGLRQQAVADGMPGLVPTAANGEGTLFRLADSSPPISYRSNIAVVLGGAAGLAAMASMPTIHLNEWAAFTADQVLRENGLAGLLELLGKSRLIIVANETVNDLAVLASSPIARLDGITSEPQLDRLTRTLPSDLSIRGGALRDPAAPVARPAPQAQAKSFELSAPAAGLEIWARVHVNPSAARLALALDGKETGQITPVAPRADGFTWLRVPAGPLTAGVHRLSMTVGSSSYGHSFEVEEVRLIRAADRERAADALVQTLTARADHVMYSLDLNDAEKWDRDGVDLRSGTAVADAREPFWNVLEPGYVERAPARPADPKATSVIVRSERTFHTVLTHDFAAPQDWSDSQYVFLRFRGMASGQSFRFAVDSGDSEAQYTFTDDKAGWWTLAFATSRPDQVTGSLDWSRISRVKVGIDARTADAQFSVERPRLSRTPARSSFTYPLIPSPSARTAVFMRAGPSPTSGGLPRAITVPAHATSVRVGFPPALSRAPVRLVINPPAPVHQERSPRLRVTRTGLSAYSFSVRSEQPGVLLLAQGYDARWIARQGRSRMSPLPAFSLANAYLLPGGEQRGIIGFEGQRLAWIGAGISGSAVAVIGLVFVLSIVRRRAGAGKRGTRGRDRLRRSASPGES
jgi:hypothetical protein